MTGKDDSRTLDRMIDMADCVFDHNPRNVKQFVNMFRLQAFIANETGLFGSDRVSRGGLTIPQLGKFVLLSMRWPQFIAAASANTSLIKSIEAQTSQASERKADPGDTNPWIADRHLMRLLTFGVRDFGMDYSLAEIDLATLNEIVPARSKRTAEPTAQRAIVTNVEEQSTKAPNENSASRVESQVSPSGDFPEINSQEDFIRRPGLGGKGVPSTWGKVPQEPPPAS